MLSATKIDRLYGDDQAQLTCNRPMGVAVDLSPTWHLNGIELDIGLREKYSVTAEGTGLTIFNIAYSDEGNYTCRFNQVVSAPVLLRVVGKWLMYLDSIKHTKVFFIQWSVKPKEHHGCLKLSPSH